MRDYEIDGATALTAILGDPVGHSRSPAMHNAAYAALGMNRRYAAFHVRPAQFAPALRAIPALGILGVNLTVPHKETAARILKAQSAEARLLGAVNCVVNRNGKLFGDNSDARGLELALRELGCDLRGKVAVVVGAGGGAAAAILACKRLGAGRIAIVNRTRSRAAALARRFSDKATRGTVESRGLDALGDSRLMGAAQIVVNATPMGLTTRRFAPLDYASTPADCLFYDLIYSSEPTPFLKPALASGRRGADGVAMLVYQGEIAFKLFNRVAPPAGVMRAALFAALGRRG